MYRILICEDEENIVSFLRTELLFEGFQVEVAYDGNSAIELFKNSVNNTFDLVLLDIMLPIKNGLECLREIRKTSSMPVIILTARKDVYEKVAFLNSGADDYITKPFDTLELIARIKRNIERTKVLSAATNELLHMSEDDYRAFIGDNEILLTKTEFETLIFLYKNKNKVMSRNQIIKAVFGDFYGESNVVDANIKNIRAKLMQYTDKEIISTVRGKGYVIRS